VSDGAGGAGDPEAGAEGGGETGSDDDAEAGTCGGFPAMTRSKTRAYARSASA
jgi:hypothetical protein